MTVRDSTRSLATSAFEQGVKEKPKARRRYLAIARWRLGSEPDHTAAASHCGNLMPPGASVAQS